MRKAQRYVYYCEFCKKKSLNAAVVTKHERGCTNNPYRVCGMCKRENILPLIEDFKSRFILHEIITDDYEGGKPTKYFEVEWQKNPITLEEIKSSVDDCPNCVLAILRQTKLNYQCCGLEQYDYKEENSAYWTKVSRESMFNYCEYVNNR